MATGDPGSFRVHLESLVDFARELDTQLDALRGPADLLAGIGGRPLSPGRFVSAHALRHRHSAAAGQLQDLLVGAGHAVAFAEEVTRTIAAEYARYDEEVAASFRSLGAGVGDAALAGGAAGGGFAGGGPRGTVYVSQTARGG